MRISCSCLIQLLVLCSQAFPQEQMSAEMWHGAKTANITVKRALLRTWFFVLTVAHGLSGVNEINASSEFKLIPCIICSNLEFPVIGPNLPVPSVDDIPGVLHKTCGSV